jgi:phosphatidylserine/phosphatidylglycerophosphate/cardiolipin synthase-like enzyme
MLPDLRQERTPDPHSWFDQGEGMPPVLPGNDVRYLIDGEHAFREMTAAMLATNGPGDFIYIVNWFCDVDFPLVGNVENGQTAHTLRDITERASAAGVMVRALLWKEPDSSQNSAAVAFFNGAEAKAKDGHHTAARPRLLNVAAIHDDRGDKPFSLAGIRILGSVPRALGAQHQKILCVFAGGRLVSFCGGMDFKEDRIGIPAIRPAGSPAARVGSVCDAPAGEGEPLHDVHCRITGPAALELVKLFAEKWNDHPAGVAFNASKGELIVPPLPARAGDHVVQVSRTYKAGVYQFRPKGEYSAARMIGHAIRNARRFIYTECQYFTGSPALAEALLAALPNIEHLTVLMTHWELSDVPYVNSRRRRFIRTLTADADHAHKVRLFTLQPEGNTALFQAGRERHTYVHSKIWIIDDEFAVIGSVNSNQRSWMHDSEVAAGIYDPSTDPTHPRLPHALRIDLWQEHLNMHTSQGAVQLWDGVTGAAHWLHPPTGARVRAHDPDERNRQGKNDQALPFPFPNFIADTDLVWNNVFDPD